ALPITRSNTQSRTQRKTHEISEEYENGLHAGSGFLGSHPHRAVDCAAGPSAADPGLGRCLLPGRHAHHQPAQAGGGQELGGVHLPRRAQSGADRRPCGKGPGQGHAGHAAPEDRPAHGAVPRGTDHAAGHRPVRPHEECAHRLPAAAGPVHGRGHAA
ncbi:hypothetical protein COLO4_00807, partial [Corchorus olitorius]